MTSIVLECDFDKGRPTNILSNADDANKEEHKNTGELIIESICEVIVEPQSGGANASEFAELPDERGVHCAVAASAPTSSAYVAARAARSGVVMVVMMVIVATPAPVSASAAETSAVVSSAMRI